MLVYLLGQAYEHMLMKMRIYKSEEVRNYADMILVELRRSYPFLKRVDVESRGVEWSNYLKNNQDNIDNYVLENLNNSPSKPQK